MFGKIVSCLKRRSTASLDAGALSKTVSVDNRSAEQAPAIGAQQRPEGLLQASEELFKQFVEEIDHVFWMTSPDKSQLIYISPAYETIWGRTCDSLYASRESWLDAIHPDDREFIMRAVMTTQVDGKYDYEYRIVKPDGSIRWIRDRAFPIRDASGKVYRIAGVAQDITDGKRLLETQQRNFTERERLEREILEISDREQRRIGQDLHDSICQQLVSTAFASNLLSRKLATVAPAEADTAGKIAGWIDEAISQTRILARGLYPVKLEADGLASALQELAEYVTDRFGIACELENTDGILVIENKVATHVYRIAQEAVTNAVKHSQADRIRITLANEDHAVSMEVQDNGVGIPDGITNGMGLHIMQYRTRIIDGALAIRRGTDGGTVVVSTFPQKTSAVEESKGSNQAGGK
jgi:PAS domain S-box-containing protein